MVRRSRKTRNVLLDLCMAKLCAKGKAAAKRKFKVYPSAYANMYASGVCSGRIKPKSAKKKTTKRKRKRS